ncbi:hypothetical protein, partial [Vibrio kanaloae]|uniref:hypothetical protein n=1 Tax=Vibrio kanaloae TaxID=170673 RepID=UPI001C1006B0
PIITQKKIDGVGYDYKALVFFDKVYVLKRNVRKNDFRSSGSGDFEFVEVEPNILNFADKFRRKLKTPYVSMDIMKDTFGVLHCIEFQAVHFGPYTQINAPHYYMSVGGEWEIIRDEKKSLESDIVYAVDRFIHE